MLRTQKKAAWLSAIIVICIAVWFIPITREFLNQALLLSKYAGADFNTFSSGRVILWKRAADVFLESPVIGSGKHYVDCSYLLILAESGLVGFFIIETIWINKAYSCFSFRGDSNCRGFLFFMTVFYIIESVFEGYPPFGPGASSFLFWFYSSLIINQQSGITKNINRVGGNSGEQN